MIIPSLEDLLRLKKQELASLDDKERRKPIFGEEFEHMVKTDPSVMQLLPGFPEWYRAPETRLEQQITVLQRYIESGLSDDDFSLFVGWLKKRRSDSPDFGEEGFYGSLDFLDQLTIPFFEEAISGYARLPEEQGRQAFAQIIAKFLQVDCIPRHKGGYPLFKIADLVPASKRKTFLDGHVSLFEALEKEIPSAYFTFVASSAFAHRLPETLAQKYYQAVTELGKVYPSTPVYFSRAMMWLLKDSQIRGKEDFIDNLLDNALALGEEDPIIANMFFETIPLYHRFGREVLDAFYGICSKIARNEGRFGSRPIALLPGIDDSYEKFTAEMLSYAGNEKELEKFFVFKGDINASFIYGKKLDIAFPTNFLTSFVVGIPFAKEGMDEQSVIDYFTALSNLDGRHLVSLRDRLYVMLGRVAVPELPEEMIQSYFRAFRQCSLLGSNAFEEFLDSAGIFIIKEDFCSLQDYLIQINRVVEFGGELFARFPKLYGLKLAGDELSSEDNDVLETIFDFVEDREDQLEEICLHLVRKIEEQSEASIIDISHVTKFWYQTRDQANQFIRLGGSGDASISPAFERCISGLLEIEHADELGLVDLGCGDGKKSLTIHNMIAKIKKVPRVYFCDSSDEFLRMAKSNARERGIRARKIKLDLSHPISNHFELREDYPHLFLFLGQTLGNFDNPKQIMQNISDGLRPGDYLVLEVDLEKDMQTYKKCEYFFRRYMKVLGFSDSDIDYHAEENDDGVEMYFMTNTLTRAKTTSYEKFVPEQTKIRLASSARFTKGKVVGLVESTGLKAKFSYAPPGNGKIVSIFSKI